MSTHLQKPRQKLACREQEAGAYLNSLDSNNCGVLTNLTPIGSQKLPYEASTTLDYWGGYMVSELRRQSVVLDRPTWDRLRVAADDAGITKSELVRSAVEHYLAFRSGQSWNPNRIAELVEYSQMAVDQMLLKLAPETRDEIIEAVDIRMEQYHGG